MKKGNSKAARKARIERVKREHGTEVVKSKKKKKSFYVSPLREAKSK